MLRCLAEEVFDLFLIFDFARVDLALVDTVEGRRDLFRERADLVAIVCRCSHTPCMVLGVGCWVSIAVVLFFVRFRF